MRVVPTRMLCKVMQAGPGSGVYKIFLYDDIKSKSFGWFSTIDAETSAKKIAANVHAAIDRIKCDACPPNCIRLNKQTPCAITGKCGNCLSPGNTVCCNTNVTRYCSIPDRIHVILINEDLGF